MKMYQTEGEGHAQPMLGRITGARHWGPSDCGVVMYFVLRSRVCSEEGSKNKKTSCSDKEVLDLTCINRSECLNLDPGSASWYSSITEENFQRKTFSTARSHSYKKMFFMLVCLAVTTDTWIQPKNFLSTALRSSPFPKKSKSNKSSQRKYPTASLL